MTKKNPTAIELSTVQSIEKLFLRFLVGKNRIYHEEDYNDGLPEGGSDDEKKNELPEAKNGWNERKLLDVEKERVERVKAEQRVKDKRNAVLTRYFQQLLLKVINEKLADGNAVILNQLRFRESTVELLKALLASEPRYSTLATLLDTSRDVRKRLLLLVGNPHFMRELGREPRTVRDTQSAIGIIGTDVLRYLVPAIFFKTHIDVYSQHNPLFTKKLWRYQMTLGQTCSAFMVQEKYRRPYEGMLLSAMANLAFVASYQQYISSFEAVRMSCLDQARDKGDKSRHEFFFDLQTDSASLQALLLSKADLKLSLALAEKLFQKDFRHLVNALREEVEGVAFAERGTLGKILFKAIRFAKYEQLRASRLFKPAWLDDYLQDSQLDEDAYKALLRQELFRFKPVWL